MEQLNADRRRFFMGGKRKFEQDRYFQEALDPALWQTGDAENWHACWYTGMPKPAMFQNTAPDRKINHIPGNNSLTVKSRLYETVVAMRDRILAQYGPQHDYITRLNFLPRVFSMPDDYHLLQQSALENPDQRWILKPKNSARGKGVRLVRDVASVPMRGSWLVQEYVANPHTMHSRKYVLRLYVLIASIEPLRVYLYQQGFAKLASAPYDLHDTENVYSHLTNPDVNALNTAAEVPVEFVDFEHYRQWLRDGGHDDDILFEKIRDLVTLTAISAVEPMRKRTRDCGANPRGCYELLGIDCLIDDQLKPWILECNLSPSLGVCAGPESGGEMEAKIKRKLVADLVSLVALNSPFKESGAADPATRIRAEAESEHARAGGFERLYPNTDVAHYLPFFALPRLSDMILADAVAPLAVVRPQLQRRDATEMIIDEQVAVFETRTGRLDVLNQSASFIWLMAVEGVDPEQIAAALTAATNGKNIGAPPPASWTIRNDVWNCLADWAQAGLLVQKADSPKGNSKLSSPLPTDSRLAAQLKPSTIQLKPSTMSMQAYLTCGGQQFAFSTDSQAVMARFGAILSPRDPEQAASHYPRLEVVCDTPGYTAILDGEIIKSRLTLAELGSSLIRHLAQGTLADGDLFLDACIVTDSSIEDGSLLIVNAESELPDAFALHYASQRGYEFARGLRYHEHSLSHAQVLGLPVQHEGFLVPSQPMDPSVPQRIDTIVIAYRDTGGKKGGIRVASLRETLSHLLPVCYAANRQPMAAQTLMRLVVWLAEQHRYLVNVVDDNAAVNSLQQRLNPLGTVLEGNLERI